MAALHRRVFCAAVLYRKDYFLLGYNVLCFGERYQVCERRRSLSQKFEVWGQEVPTKCR